MRKSHAPSLKEIRKRAASKTVTATDIRTLLALIRDVQSTIDAHRGCVNDDGDVDDCAVLTKIDERLTLAEQ